MSHRNRTGLYGLLSGGALLLALACGGLDDVKVVIIDMAGSGGDPSGGASASGGKPSAGDTSANSGASGTSGSAGSAGEEASGGEGGQMPTPDPTPGPPSVISVSPSDGALGADVVGPIRVNFSEPLDPSSVTSSSVQIKDGTGAVLLGGTLSAAGAVVTFSPRDRLNLLGTYTVNVSATVTDAGGTPMTRPYMSTFTTRDGVWRRDEGALTTNTNSFDRNSPIAMASDGVGRAVAAWTQATDSTGNYDIYAALFNQGLGWAAPVKVNSNALRCEYPSVSMNASGNLIVAWIEYDSSIAAQPYSIQSRRYLSGAWDATPTRVDTATMNPYILNLGDVAVAMTANGHAHVVWTAYDNNTGVSPSVNDYAVFARHANQAGTWDTNVVSLTNLQVGSGVSPPALAFDAAGNGFAAYQIITSASPKVTTLVQRFLSTTNKWGPSAISSTPSDGAPQPVAVSTSPTGEAVLAWPRTTIVDTSTTNYEMMGAYFNKDWKALAVISSAVTSLSYASHALASATWTGSSFLVAWAQSAGNLNNIYTNEYKSAWGSATIISDGTHNAALPWLTADGRGNALAVWFQLSESPVVGSTTPYDVVSARLVGATDKWSNPVHVSSTAAGYRFPQAVTLADGTVLASWQRTLNNNLLKSLLVNGVFENALR